MRDHMIKTVTAKYQSCLTKLGWKPGMVPLTVKAPWYGVVEWSAPSYDRDRVFSGIGTLVGPRHVLTCAQRFDPKMDEHIVTKGGLPIADKVFSFHIGGVFGSDCEVQHVITHPKFRPVTTPGRLPRKSMDLAMLVLTEDLDIPPVSIAESARPYERISALGTTPLADGPYDPVQFDTACIHTLAGATARPWGKEFVVANAPDPDGMGPGFVSAPMVTAGPGETKLIGLVSRPALGLPTKDTLGAPCVVTDVIRQAKWVNAMMAAYPARPRR